MSSSRTLQKPPAHSRGPKIHQPPASHQPKHRHNDKSGSTCVFLCVGFRGSCDSDHKNRTSNVFGRYTRSCKTSTHGQVLRNKLQQIGINRSATPLLPAWVEVVQGQQICARPGRQICHVFQVDVFVNHKPMIHGYVETKSGCLKSKQCSCCLQSFACKFLDT